MDNKGVNETLENLNSISNGINHSSTGNIREKMQESMQTYASVYKSKDLLEKGFNKRECIIKTYYYSG